MKGENDNSEQARKATMVDEIMRLKYSLPIVRKQQSPASKIYERRREKQRKRLRAAAPVPDLSQRYKDVFENHIVRERRELMTLSVGDLSVLLDDARAKQDFRPENRHKQTKELPQGRARHDAPLDEFRSMQNLTADELTITFISGDMLEITARGVTKRVPLASLNLLDRRKGVLNIQGGILLGFARGRRLSGGEKKRQQQIRRLRAVFKQFLGISADPFYPFKPGVGWEPRFEVKDNRNAPDERAKRDAAHVPFDEGARYALFDEPEHDEAQRWLNENDPETK